jgi:Holliday junction resolvase-like predicted endonuclease
LALKEDLQALYAHFGVPGKHGIYSTQQVREHLRDLAAKALPQGDDIGADELFRLQRHLILRHLVDGEELHPIFEVVEVLRDVVRPRAGRCFANFDAEAGWRNAVQRCLDYLTLRSPDEQLGDATFRAVHVRTVNVAEAAARLRQAGMNLAVESGHIIPATGEIERAGARLHTTVQELGGAEVTARLLTSMEPLFDPHMGRYHLVRNLSNLSEYVRPQVPFGYLLNLAVREVHVAPKRRLVADEFQRRWEDLVAEATDLVAILNVQPYTIYENMFMGPEQLTRTLQQEALYDSAFTLVQLRPSDIVPMLKGLFEWVDEGELRARVGWTLGGAVEVTECILRNATAPHGCHFRTSDIAAHLRHRSKGEVRKILLALSHEPGKVNEGYTLPTHGERVTFGFRPLIRLHDDSYLLVSPSWCGPAFYEAIAASLRGAGFAKVQERLGDATEAFARAVLEHHGVPSRSGQYMDSIGKEGECDAAVESTKDVIFIEMKGKALTRAARAGTIPNLMADVAASFLKAQAQAGGHEVRIRRDGHLQLKHKTEGEYLIELQGREVERVALTLLEYGAFQDRVFCQGILGAVINAVIRVDDAVWKKKFQELFASQSDLRTQVQEQLDLAGGDLGPNPFMNVTFLSIPQLLVLLDGVDSPDSFRSALWSNRHTTFGTRDFYFELSQMRRLKAAAPSPEE